MSRDIRNFVTTCDTCSKNKKPTRYGRWNMTNYHAGAPMERVHIDFMGPLPKTKSGNEHILMMVDQFTKWTVYTTTLPDSRDYGPRISK